MSDHEAVRATAQSDEAIHELDAPSAPAEALEVVKATAEAWGGEWSPSGGAGGALRLPLSAGLRMGVAEIDVAARGNGSRGSTLRFDVREQFFALHQTATVILVLGAAGAVAILALPLFPSLLPLLPAAILLLVLSWLMVGARLKHRGLREFLDDCELQFDDPAADSSNSDGVRLS